MDDCNPLQLFHEWLITARDHPHVPECNAMRLTTISNDLEISNRVVLLKEYDWKGLTFFTNYNSNKAVDLICNPNCSLEFNWPNISRRIIVKGLASQTESEISDNYFFRRPRESQLGALASNQSAIISSRKCLLDNLNKVTQMNVNKDIKRPNHWGGFTIRPKEFIFITSLKSRIQKSEIYKVDPNHVWSKIDEWCYT
ncbi:pyridoxamine 5'-phosphate oxidase [Nonlabens sp. MIC269]|uniref:pyridoxamine 5'-phosphate oxidase n=1 Tax=Nonlabens sp. MIC269 TaxID=1476901 RepID=UPI0007620C17|nr:pyridoxamine 5'-phosphate oxidase [Nonlabens sp. MIC269]